MGVARSGSRRCRRRSIGADCGIVDHGERSGVSHNTQQRGAAEQPEHRRHYNDTPPNTRARYVPAHRKCLLATHRRLPMTTRPRPDTGSHCTLVWPLWVYRRTLCRHTATGSHLPHWQCQGTLALRSDSATIGVKRCVLLLPCTTTLLPLIAQVIKVQVAIAQRIVTIRALYRLQQLLKVVIGHRRCRCRRRR